MRLEVDDKIKQLLKDLGSAINDSISSSADVNRRIQKIRDEGYNLFVVLDATIGLNRQGEEEEEQQQPQPVPAELVVADGKDVQFRINVKDLALLRALGIDPTRKVRSLRRVEPLVQNSDD
ncbi:MAG TPA: hypothetical protein VLU46_04685 [Thermoanaerobaculia bacterium]|nr:hypothetical protein [Thermoanaerobaculia bacterium]